MAKRILILDDDADFNSLLTDVFQQADYDVTSIQDPQKALEIFRDQTFDLVVTDQRMPTLTGQEFVRELFKMRPGMPVVMVSGYLDNETIRTLIREGVGGIFLKPLNIFSLLKKTAELLEKAEEEAGGDAASHLGFPFHALPAKAEKSKAMAERLYSLRSFKSNLLLVGAEGAPFEELCTDLCGFDSEVKEELLVLHRQQLSQPILLRQLQGLGDQGCGRVTMMVVEAHSMTDPEKAVIYAMAKREGLFGKLPLQIRFVFCLHQDVDSLYDNGLIDEGLYLFLGTTEVRIPALGECPEDIPILARQILFEEAREKQMPAEPELDSTGRDYLRKQPWKGHVAELRRTLRTALNLLEGGEHRINGELLKCALEYKGVRPSRLKQRPLGDCLRSERDDYIEAILAVCGRDAELAGEVLGVSTEWVHSWQERAGTSAVANAAGVGK